MAPPVAFTDDFSCWRDRRSFLRAASWAAVGMASFAAFAAQPVSPAVAAEATLPIDYSDEFAKVREGYYGFIGALEKDVFDQNWESILTSTRQQDADFRKRLMGGLRKKLPKENKAVRGEAQALMNAVSFDLIALNKAARSGDVRRAKELLPILKEDVTQFLALEPRIYG
ncbi:unnamed protein product [Phaeothamnion confervicola]